MTVKLSWNKEQKQLELWIGDTFGDKHRKVLGGNVIARGKCWAYPITAGKTLLKVFEGEIEVDTAAQRAIDTFTKDFTHVEKLKRGEVEPRPHEFLMRHQRVCRDIASLFDSYALFLDTGTGKTCAALQIIKDSPQTRWAIVCPLNVIKLGWMQDMKDFYPDIKLLPLSRNITAKDYLELAEAWGVKLKTRRTLSNVRGELMEHAQAYIINPESFKKYAPAMLLHGVTGLFVDESVKIKNMQASITKEVLGFAKHMRRVYPMSGVPAPNNPLEFFPQIFIVDSAVFGTSFYMFRSMFFEPYGYMNYDWRLRKDREQIFAKRLNMRAIFISKEECLDLPEKTYMVREVVLAREAKHYYLQMERERFLQLQDNKAIARNTLTAIMKLRQITGGFVIDDEDNTHALHTAKLEALLELCEEIGNQQVLIWCNFRNEVRLIQDALEKLGKTVVTAYGATKRIDDNIEAFKTGKAQYMVANPASLKYGVTFIKCSYAVYYSLSYSFDDYYQSHDRIYRKGQKKPCTFIFLLCEDTIDQMLHKVIQRKGKLVEAIQEYAKRKKYKK